MWFTFVLAATVVWAITNILDSLLVKHFEKDPFVMVWCQAMISFIILISLLFIVDVRSGWKMPLIFGGFFACAGDLIFFYTVGRVDISVSNIAWAILAILLAAIGFLFLNEAWTIQQTIGAIFILLGISFLSLFHHHFTLFHIFLLTSLALFYAPFYVIQKVALLQNETVVSVLFWSILGREFLGITLPVCMKSHRCRIVRLIRNPGISFASLNVLVLILFFVASYLTARAYEVGPISLISVTSNIQPFLVIFFAWIMLRFLPRYAPREILTRQLVQVKLGSFLITFIGLALLAFSV